jgi:hypothetical protein
VKVHMEAKESLRFSHRNFIPHHTDDDYYYDDYYW